jgi:hypothetical protein
LSAWIAAADPQLPTVATSWQNERQFHFCGRVRIDGVADSDAACNAQE